MTSISGLFIGGTVAKIILLIFNTLGNLLVIQAIAKAQRLRTASNFLVANLALCDLLAPLLNIPIDISVESVGRTWHYGPVMCKLVWPLATSFTTSSALTLVAISIDRSRALRHPFVTKLTGRQSLGIILLLHIFSMIVIVPYAMASVVKDGKCDEDWSRSIFTAAQYTLIVFHVQYAIPLVILAYVYSKAARYLRRCTLSLVILEEDHEARPSTWRRVRTKKKKKNPNRSKSIKIRREQNAHVVKMFAVVVAVFAIFTLPNNIRWLLTDFGNYSSYEHSKLISFLCVMCTYANCLANPIIYGTLSRDYKDHFMRILSFGRCKCSCSNDNLGQRPTRLQSTLRVRDGRSEINGREVVGTMV